MNSLFELLRNLKKRPTLYCQNSIFAFKAYYEGYLMAKQIYSLPQTEEEQEFELFLQWLEDVYALGKVKYSWDKVMFVGSVDERDALNRLFDLFDFYLEDKKSESEENKNEQDFEENENE